MKDWNTKRASGRSGGVVIGVSLAIALVGAAGFLGLSLAGCAADEPVGHSKTVTKTTEQTPEGEKTTTYTHERDTKIIDK